MDGPLKLLKYRLLNILELAKSIKKYLTRIWSRDAGGVTTQQRSRFIVLRRRRFCLRLLAEQRHRSCRLSYLQKIIR